MGREPKKPKERKVPRNLSADTWVEIQAQWEAGVPGSELARKYGLTPSAITHRAKKDGWLRGASIKTRAIEEARQEVKEKLKDTYKDLVEKANEQHMKLANYGEQFGIILWKELEINMKALQKQRLDMGHTDENPICLHDFGKINGQYKSIWETLESVARFKRDVLKMGEHNSWMSDEENQDSIQRLNEIFEEGRKRYEEVSGDADKEATTAGEAVHPDNPPK
jgi:hypothetical protein